MSNLAEMQIDIPDNTIEVTVSDVSITNVGFAIFLKPTKEQNPKVVPIFIGPLETYSISSALDGIRPPRPNTHDLFVELIHEMEATVSHVVINDMIGSVFYARIIVQTEGGVIEMDARPSDTVAIAIRTKCPMFMHQKVYEEAGVVIKNAKDDEEYESDESYTSSPSESETKVQGSELEKLKNALQKAVDSENFEQAALLRDQIRRLTQEN